MFGTFVPENPDEKCRYGLVYNLSTFNPLRIAFHEWAALARDIFSARSFGDILKFAFAPPGWSPDESRETSHSLKEKWQARQKHAAMKPPLREAPHAQAAE
jgi:hypothetical protein